MNIWIDDFLGKYFFSSDKINDAIEIKRQNIPDKLFRYRPVSCEEMCYREKELCGGWIYLQHPKDVNDCFESCSILSSRSMWDYQNKNAYKKSFSNVMSEEELVSVFEKGDWVENICGHPLMVKFFDGDKESARRYFEEKYSTHFENLNAVHSNVARDSVRFASFSTRSDNIPMWCHYAKDYSGICVEYEVKKIKEGTLNVMFPVIYRDVLPDIIMMTAKNILPLRETFKYLAIHKLNDWSYEEEWRLLIDAKDIFNSPDDVPEEFWNTGGDYKFTIPTKVILGLKMNKYLKETIIGLAKKSGIKVTQSIVTEHGLGEKAIV